MLKRVIMLFSIFCLFWLSPLLLPVATLYRYALEEIRVLAVGLIIGYLACYWQLKKEA